MSAAQTDQWGFDQARQLGWPEQNLHSSASGAAARQALPCRAEKSKKPSRSFESILEAVEAAGIDAPFLCAAGLAANAKPMSSPAMARWNITTIPRTRRQGLGPQDHDLCITAERPGNCAGSRRRHEHRIQTGTFRDDSPSEQPGGNPAFPSLS
jgi:hypothetical protein